MDRGHDTVQEAMIKTIPKKKKCKKAKWLSEEALQIAVKRREVKSKGEKERYTHLNAEFQRIARRERKPSSEINAKKQRKTMNLKVQRSLQENQRYQGGTFHLKMGTIKDRNGRDLTEAEDIKKKWQGHTEELY